MKFPIKLLSQTRYTLLKRSTLQARMDQLQELERSRDLIFSQTSLQALDPQTAFTIIDVGANTGDVSLNLAGLFPRAQIFAIEADPQTYLDLVKKTEAAGTIRPVQLGIHSHSGWLDFHSHPNSVFSSLINLPDSQTATRRVKIKTETLDQFVAANRINNVALLKIDTEGNDLEVLKGADTLLTSPDLKHVICEFGIHPEDKRHVNINDLLRFMAQKGFYISSLGNFGCYVDYVFGNVLFVRAGFKK